RIPKRQIAIAKETLSGLFPHALAEQVPEHDEWRATGGRGPAEGVVLVTLAQIVTFVQRGHKAAAKITHHAFLVFGLRPGNDAARRVGCHRSARPVAMKTLDMQT